MFFPLSCKCTEGHLSSDSLIRFTVEKQKEFQLWIACEICMGWWKPEKITVKTYFLQWRKSDYQISLERWTEETGLQHFAQQYLAGDEDRLSSYFRSLLYEVGELVLICIWFYFLFNQTSAEGRT